MSLISCRRAKKATKETLMLTQHKPLSTVLRVLLTLTVLASMTSVAFGARIAPDFPTKGTVDVIVQFATPATASDIAALHAFGGTVKAKFDFINAAVISGFPAQSINALARNPRVVYISPDRATKTSGSLALDYMIPTVNAD